MAGKLVWSPRAAGDIIKIWDDVYLASRDPETADRYAEELLRTIEKQADHPRTGFPLFYGELFTGYYSVNYKAYKAFYRIAEDRTELLRILPGKADYLTVLFPENE